MPAAANGTTAATSDSWRGLGPPSPRSRRARAADLHEGVLQALFDRPIPPLVSLHGLLPAFDMSLNGK